VIKQTAIGVGKCVGTTPKTPSESERKGIKKKKKTGDGVGRKILMTQPIIKPRCRGLLSGPTLEKKIFGKSRGSGGGLTHKNPKRKEKKKMGERSRGKKVGGERDCTKRM